MCTDLVPRTSNDAASQRHEGPILTHNDVVAIIAAAVDLRDVTDERSTHGLHSAVLNIRYAVNAAGL